MPIRSCHLCPVHPLISCKPTTKLVEIKPVQADLSGMLRHLQARHVYRLQSFFPFLAFVPDVTTFESTYSSTCID